MRQGNIDVVRLIDVSSYSTATNYEWRAAANSSVLIPVSFPTNISVSLKFFKSLILFSKITMFSSFPSLSWHLLAIAALIRKMQSL